jgi:hypothetical protein
MPRAASALTLASPSFDSQGLPSRNEGVSSLDLQEVGGGPVPDKCGECGSQALALLSSEGRWVWWCSDLRGDDPGGAKQVSTECHGLPGLGERHRGGRERQREGGSRGLGPPRELGLGLEQVGDLFEHRLLVEDGSFDVSSRAHSEPLPR